MGRRWPAGSRWAPLAVVQMQTALQGRFGVRLWCGPNQAAVGLLEALQLFVAALDDGVQRVLGRFLAGPHAFHFLVDDGADLEEAAQTHAARLVGRLVIIRLTATSKPGFCL